MEHQLKSIGALAQLQLGGALIILIVGAGIVLIAQARRSLYRP